MAEFDYTKFVVKVFDSKGTFVKEALRNNNNEFFVQGLVPGYKYHVVIIWDVYHLMNFFFIREKSQDVVYINPQLVVFNRRVELLPEEIKTQFLTEISNSISAEIPLELYPKKALDYFIEETRDTKLASMDYHSLTWGCGKMFKDALLPNS